MRHQRRFQPQLNDSTLEDRRLLSRNSGIAPGRAEIRDMYLRAIRQDYKAVAAAVNEVVNTVLTDTGTSTTTGSTTDPQAEYEAAVTGAVQSLVADINHMLSLSPRAAGLTVLIDQALAGSGPNSLLSRLTAVTLPTDGGSDSADEVQSEVSSALFKSYRVVSFGIDAFARDPSFPTFGTPSRLGSGGRGM